ncbi:hypothetical protein JRX38_14170 [Gluconobacter cerinus]|uniref:hypothetical protein n=1 Tax=Gluconobacter cerinus TaxID=38307 RepID=UPI0019401052|nr:hypothetical protein [Gluconobacter cerinus]MBM3099133.1 hypothetical protein [Gluconobacter cerinus]
MKRFLLAASLLIPLSAHAQVSPSKWTQNYIPTLADWRAALLWNGYSYSQAMAAITNGTFPIANVADGTNALADLIGRPISITDYGASANVSGAINAAAITQAITAAQSKTLWLDFPYNSSGYTITGTFTAKELGYFNFGNNVLSGTGIGTPSSGAGTLNSLYTNPYLIVTGIKEEMDPAGQAVPGTGSANIGHAWECLPNASQAGDASTTKRMVSCTYIGVDTGSGGASGTDKTIEALNIVENLNTNHSPAMEIDLNYNGTVADGGWSDGLFITGGGAAGNTTNASAIDIQHSAYDGTWLPWTTGISIRDATNQLLQYKMTDSEAGFFQEAFNAEGNAIWKVDKNGYGTAAGYTTSGAVTAGSMNASGGITSGNGFVSSPSVKVAYTGQAQNADDFVATRNSSTDTGYFFRAFSESALTLASIDKNGYYVGAGYTSTGTITSTGNIIAKAKVCLDATCARYVYESGSKVYFGNTTNGNVASIDDSGNMILKGSLTQSGTP